MTGRLFAWAAALLLLLPGTAARAADGEERTARLFDSIVGDPARLRVFLKAMPKGGDLHNHLSGAPYAEDYLRWAGERGWCIATATSALVPPPCVGVARVPAAGLSSRDGALYQRMIDALSMRGHLAGVGANDMSGHDAMFGSFGRFGDFSDVVSGESLVAVRRMAAADRVSYLELIFNPPSVDRFAGETRDPAWRAEDMAAAHARMKPMLPALLAKARAEVDGAEADARAALHCGAAADAAACAIETRYIAYGARVLPPAQLFRELVLIFAMAAADPRFVAINLVAPEDDPASLENYALTMRMIGFLAPLYPGVHRTLHAGELAAGLVPPGALADHVGQAVAIAGAERIGHGSDIAHEVDSIATLARMARDRVAVEINLVSNDEILGLRGGAHPLSLYRAAGVPVALSTDDEGVLRTDMTEQYVRAAVEHRLDYGALKSVARDSLTYSFLPGASLWREGAGRAVVPACADLDAPACDALASGSPKARMQRALERQFQRFESGIVTARF
ncbi:adenosine deaminase [Sphingomonas sp.]|uniref:adenosine deaminase n=1 Tax=Sphingomonas sp. TaxID=28214 RepID=UPI000DB4BD3E|nr:adenosine deaminase [Sphingomonas sp.]PZU10177.1 MAG: adenosine deaminase [Sphingomonas sp.]